VLALATRVAAGPPTWMEQGPREIGIPFPFSMPTGAINAIAPSPTDPNVLYVGTVNGGIWKATNAAAVLFHGEVIDSPTWSPLTDQQLPALAIASLAISPGRPNILFAGTGSTSSFDDGTGS